MKKILIINLLLLLAFQTNTFAQKFYDGNTVQNIELKFPTDDWDYRMDTAAVGAEGYTLALWCKINGVQFDSVGVKYKGNSSYKASNAKNPLHIELDYVKSQDYQGYKDIKLSNVFADATFTREQISYNILRKYMDAPDCNQAQVTINGTFYGVMTNTESINKVFLGNHFGETSGAFFKCNPIASPGGSPVLPSLVYLGKDSASYLAGYELKSKTGWSKLLSLIDTLSNQPSKLASNIDIDRVLWMLAFNNLFVNLDSYSGAFAQNYYLYQNESKRFLPIVWDLNMCFGGFTQTGEAPQLSIANVPKLKLFLHETSADRPLIKQLFSNASYKKAYIAKMRTMAEENLSNGNYMQKALEIQSLIDTLVEKDNNKFFTYQQFTENLTTSASGAGAGGTGGVVIGLKALVDARLAFLNTQTAFTAAPPKIDTVIAPANILTKSVVNIQAKVQNTSNVYLRYRSKKSEAFTNVEMFDDGKHNDSAANDGTYGASFTMQDIKTEYYVYAENTAAAAFSPARAEYEFYSAKVNTNNTLVKKGDLVVNEIMASNSKTATDENGQYEDYIEIHNNTSEAIDLSYVYLTDDFSNPNKWKFKEGTSIKANEYLIVWADEDASQGDLHANFKLSASGEKVMLSNIDNSVIDSVSFPKLTADVVYARCSDATGATFKLSNPSFGYKNSCYNVGIEDISLNDFNFYPNPATHTLNIVKQSDIDNTPIEIFAISTGQKMVSTNKSNEVLDVSTWEAGVYLVKCGMMKKSLVIMK